MKTFMKKVAYLFAIAVLLMGNTAFASFPFNTDSQDCPTVAIGNFTTGVGVPSSGGAGCQSWSLTNVSANPGDTINVHIYYHNSSTANADNVRVTLNPSTSGSATTHSFTGSITSTQGNTSFGPATVTLSSAQTLTFIDLRWYPNQTATSNVSTPLPNGQSDSALISGGVSLGTIAPGWGTQGNFVAKFRVGTTQTSNPCIINNFSANPSSISSGGSSLLTWSTTNCTNATISTIGSVALNGSMTVSPSSTTTYVLNATGTNGSPSASTTVTVNNNNFCTINSFYASPSSISSGGSSVLYWTTTNANQVTVSGYGTFGPNGNVTVYPSSTTTYTLVATCNNGGSDTRTVQVFVNSNNGQEPDVDTRSATDITEIDAELNGSVDGNGDYATGWFEYGTDRYNLNRRTNTTNIGTGQRSMSETIYNLAPNTRYYFRAVGENSYGQVEGSILNFTTDASVVINNGSTSAVTTLATNVTRSSAQLNGLLLNTTTYSTNVYFEYGTTVGLGSRTISKPMGTISASPFSDFVSNLAPNTIYFFRAVAENANGTARGSIEVFRTLAPATPVTPVVVTRVATESPIMLKIENRYEFWAMGDIVDYTVTYKNIGKTTLTNPLLQVILPVHVAYTNSSRGTYAADTHTLSVPLENLAPGAEGVVYVQGRVVSLPDNHSYIVTTALLAYTNSNGAQENAMAYVLNRDYGNNLSANALFAGGFWPTTLCGWLLLIIFILHFACV